ncbi:MAG: D-alanine--D-alanine ligase [Thermodesulfobacteriota bacterium]
MAKKIELALIAGGKSGERDVSLAGASGVSAALDKGRYNVRQYDPAIDLARLADDAPGLDVAFILLHGPLGEDGAMQGFLDLLGLPYQGSGILGSALAMDKDRAKKAYVEAGLPVAPWRLAKAGQSFDQAACCAELGLPLVIKPLSQGSSLGMAIVQQESELAAALEDAFKYGDEVMVEAFIKGREITGGVLGNARPEPLPLVEIIPGADYPFFDYQAKYTKGASEEICPAQVSDDIRQRAQDYALRAHDALGLKGYSRTDMMVDASGNIYVIETNTIPGMTPTSLLPQAARAHGLEFAQFIDRLIELAMES